MVTLQDLFQDFPNFKNIYNELIAEHGQPSRVVLLDNVVKNYDHEKKLTMSDAIAVVYDGRNDPKTTVFTHRITVQTIWGKFKPGTPVTEIPRTYKRLEYMYRDCIGGTKCISKYWSKIRNSPDVQLTPDELQDPVEPPTFNFKVEGLSEQQIDQLAEIIFAFQDLGFTPIISEQ